MLERNEEVAGSHGRLFGVVPYDFRFPSLERVRRALWNPDDERFLVPTVFGVGWTVNARSVVRHSFQAGLLAYLILWRRRRRR